MASDSDLYQNLISNDVENTTAYNASSPNMLMATSVNTSLMSSFFRCVPFFITHTTPSSTPPMGVDHSTIDQSKLESESESESEFKSDSNKFVSHHQQMSDDKKSFENKEINDEKERIRLENIMNAAIQLLFPEAAKSNNETLLGIKILLEIDHEQILEEFEDSPEARLCDESQTYELNAEDAIGLLLDYKGFWKHSCSFVLTEVVTSPDKIVSSKMCGRIIEENNQSSSGFAEVVLFVLVDGQIDDKQISDSEQLKKFLSEQLKEFLSEPPDKKTKVHATCSSVATKD